MSTSAVPEWKSKIQTAITENMKKDKDSISVGLVLGLTTKLVDAKSRHSTCLKSTVSYLYCWTRWEPKDSFRPP